ncbi:MAG: hypothetical protein IRY98_05270 [Alicyclobacillaceae bacterium]|nr:hypothetical protein [Alicyclobacillaceae bacterium]
MPHFRPKKPAEAGYITSFTAMMVSMVVTVTAFLALDHYLLARMENDDLCFVLLLHIDRRPFCSIHMQHEQNLIGRNTRCPGPTLLWWQILGGHFFVCWRSHVISITWHVPGPCPARPPVFHGNGGWNKDTGRGRPLSSRIGEDAITVVTAGEGRQEAETDILAGAALPV